MKKSGSPKIELAELCINNVCNMSCRHCSYVLKANGRAQLGLSQWISIAAHLISLGAKRLHICGKEPLLSPWVGSLLGVLDSFKRYANFRYGMVTNGTLLHQCLDWISERSIDYVDVSIDGLERGHEYLRGTGSYNLTKDNVSTSLPVLGSNRVTISTVACSHNLKEIPQLVEEFAELGVRYFFIQPVQLFGRAAYLRDLRVSGPQYLQLLDELVSRNLQANLLIEMYVDYPFKKLFYERCDLFFRTCEAAALGEPLAFKVPLGELQLTFNWDCYAYRHSLTITPYGELLGCSTQAAAARSVGPSAGFLTELELKDLLYRTAQSNFYDSYFRCRQREKPLYNLDQVGVTDCPIAKELREANRTEIEANSCKEIYSEQILPVSGL